MLDVLQGISAAALRTGGRGAGGANEEVEQSVRRILEDIQKNGNTALRAYTKRFDGVNVQELFVSEEEIDQAVAMVPPALLETIRRAAKNIRAYHERQVRQGFSYTREDGVLMGQRVLPLARVGVYVPGGTAAYPSTVLMNVIPAKIAGVQEILLATPPGEDGRVHAPILAAAREAGITRICRMGGAQAIGALAYGTETIPKVDKITGPGNIYVATAKRQVYGIVDIDMIAGPSELLIIAEEGARAAYIAADMLAQAEHDVLAASILLTTSQALAAETAKELERQLALLPRREMAEKSLRDHGRIVVVDSLAEAAALSDAVAPEHLELCVQDPFALLGRIRNAGSVFLGQHTPEALGDYYAGPNHVLPTGGTARFASPLSVDDFVKKSSFLYYPPAALEDAAEDIITFARAEGLEAHANSVAVRMEAKTGEKA